MKISFAHIEKARVQNPEHPSEEGSRTGMFVMLLNENTAVHMLSDCGSMSGWERVIISVTRKNEDKTLTALLPDLMLVEQIKNMFWDENECVVIYFHKDVPSPEKGAPVMLFKSKRQNYLLPSLEIITPDSKPENVIPLPQPSTDQKTP